MKLLWYGISPMSHMGGGKVTRELLSRLKGEKIVLAPIAHWNEPIQLPHRITVISCGDPDGVHYVCNTEAPDVLVVYGPVHFVSSFLRSCKQLNIPLLVYLTLEYPSQIPLPEMFKQKTFAKLLVPSRWNQTLLAEDGYDSIVLPHGVDLDHYRPQKGETNAETFTFGSQIGFNPTNRKSPQVPLEAFSAIRHPNWRFLISGKSMVIRAKDHRIQMCPYSQKGLILPESLLPERYHSFDVHLYDTKGESFGLAMIEAAACGLPQIVSDLPVNHEVLGDGALYAEACPKEWGELMEYLYGNEKTHKILSRNGIAQAKQFSWHKASKIFEQVLKDVIG